MTVYVSIGNSDDKLTQQQWSRFCADTETILCGVAKLFHGNWRSKTDDPWQNACWCFEPWPHVVNEAKARLCQLAVRYGQEWIAWAEAETEPLNAEHVVAGDSVFGVQHVRKEV